MPLRTVINRVAAIWQAVAIWSDLSPTASGSWGPEHPNTLTARAELASSYWSAGGVEAIAILERITADREHLLGPGHSDTLTTRVNLGDGKTERDEKSRRD